jgi:hypothetical protein
MQQPNKHETGQQGSDFKRWNIEQNAGTSVQGRGNNDSGHNDAER